MLSVANPPRRGLSTVAGGGRRPNARATRLSRRPGALARDRSAFPFTNQEMPNAKNRLSEADYRTAAYDLGTFTDRPFNDAGLLDAAKRAERDRTEVGGLDTGS